MSKNRYTAWANLNLERIRGVAVTDRMQYLASQNNLTKWNAESVFCFVAAYEQNAVELLSHDPYTQRDSSMWW